MSLRLPAPPPPDELVVACLVVDDGSVKFATTRENATGAGLKAAIATAFKFKFLLSRLELYSAFDPSDRTWLLLNSDLRERARSGNIPVDVVKRMTDKNLISPESRLRNYKFTDLQATPSPFVVHVLVKKPEVTHPWLPESAPEYALSNQKLFFVGQEEAFPKTLYRAHLTCFSGSRDWGNPYPWSIPLVDNASGLGKTAFVENYINQCRQKWSGESLREGFPAELRQCHTLILRPPQRRLADGTVSEEIVNGALAEAMKAQLDCGSEWGLLSAPFPDSALSFVESLVSTFGPLYIVISEIGEWFNFPDDDMKSRDCFIKFCRDVLLPWLHVQGLYFVVEWSASFLQYVYNSFSEEDEKLLPSGHFFSRLDLRLLQPEQIKVILSNTKSFGADCAEADEAGEQTLKDRWGLESEEKLTQAAMLLYRRSSGHPHTLMKLLDHHKTYQSFLNAKEPERSQMERQSLFRELGVYQDQLREWLVDGKRVNLTKKFTDTKERVPFEQIASRCHLSCEGSTDKARVYALPDVKPVIAAMMYPLHDFIEYLTFSKQTMGLPEVALEWLCLKRMQEASWEDDMLEEILGDSATREIWITLW